MNKPEKTLASIRDFYINETLSLQKLIGYAPEGTDPTLIKIEPLEYEYRVSWPVYEANPNYESEMVKYNSWRFQRINELERELRELKPEPGRLPDDSD